MRLIIIFAITVVLDVYALTYHSKISFYLNVKHFDDDIFSKSEARFTTGCTKAISPLSRFHLKKKADPDSKTCELFSLKL
jgi:hypothetical protein